MNQLVLISPMNLPNILSLVHSKIDAATAYSVGKYNGNDVVQKIADGSMQLWAAVDEDDEKILGIAITEIAIFPQKRVLRFLCATGEGFHDWIDHMEAIEQWGTDMGCKSFQAECRPGWKRSLATKGYTQSHIIMNKEIGSWH